MIELTENFDLANGCDGKAFFLVLEADFLEGNDLLRDDFTGFVDLTVSA